MLAGHHTGQPVFIDAWRIFHLGLLKWGVVV